MNQVMISADSTCDLPANLQRQRHVYCFALSILLGDTAYADGVEIRPADIYTDVAENHRLPKTAAVPPGVYYDKFKQWTDAGCSVVHIGLSSAISSSYQNACTAAADLDNVYCIDSKNLCMGMGLLVLRACDLRDSGMDARRIAAKVSRLVPKVSSTFVLSDLEYLYKGGRCSGVARFGANVLGIKPSIAVTPEGSLEVSKKYRGKIDSVYRQYVTDRLLDLKRMDTGRIVLADSGGVAPDTLAFLRGVISGKTGCKELILADAGCTISSHCGPGTLAVFYLQNKSVAFILLNKKKCEETRGDRMRVKARARCCICCWAAPITSVVRSWPIDWGSAAKPSANVCSNCGRKGTKLKPPSDWVISSWATTIWLRQRCLPPGCIARWSPFIMLRWTPPTRRPSGC